MTTVISLKEMVQGYAPALLSLGTHPYWACVYAPEGAGRLEDLSLEIWQGPNFLDWQAEHWPTAIIAVLPATGFRQSIDQLAPGPRHAHDRHHAGRSDEVTGPTVTAGQILCAVHEDGDAYAIWLPASGRKSEGTPSAGYLLDLVRSKLLLPPCGPSTYALVISCPEPGG